MSDSINDCIYFSSYYLVAILVASMIFISVTEILKGMHGE